MSYTPSPTLPGVLLTGTHAQRPSTAIPTGTVYSCTTHGIVYQWGGSSWSSWATAAGLLVPLTYVIDGGGTTITTGVKGDLEVPFAWSDIASARLFADQSGSIVVNIWKDTYANFPPTSGDKITASAPPTISSATKSEDTTLTGWTKTGSAGDILRFNVDSVTTIQRVTLSLALMR